MTRRLSAPLPLVLLSACGADWSMALEADDRGMFLQGWAPADDDVWIVGGQEQAGVVLRGDGTDFEPMVLPDGTPLLNWVDGNGADDVWVGGIAGTLMHWDGSAWTSFDLDVPEAVWGLDVDGDDVVVVGGASGFGGEVARTWRGGLDGFAPLDLPEPVADARNVFKVARHGGAVWAVGESGLAMRDEGAGWQALPTGVTADFVTITSDGTDLVAVGGGGTGVVFEGDGDTLTQTATPPVRLSGVVLVGDGTALVGGDRGRVGLYDLATDEVAFDDPVPGVPDNGAFVFHGCFTTPSGQQYVVGGDFLTSADTFTGWVITR